jgi:TolB-like protein
VSALAVVALAVVGLLTLRPPSPAPLDQRVAVLPFENRSGNSEQDFLVSGLHDGVMGQLSRLAQLSVIARTSVMSYLGTEKPVQAIGQELDADALVYGSVSAVDDSLSVVIEVIDPETQTNAWSGDYRVATSEVGSISGIIAQEVASSLGLQGLSQARDTVLPQVHLRRGFKPFVEDELPGLIAGRRALLAHPGDHPACPRDVGQPL